MVVGYPTALLDGKARIAFNPGAVGTWFKTIRQISIVSFVPYLFLSGEEIDKLQSKLRGWGECEIEALLNPIPGESRGLAHPTATWLTKLNVIRVVSTRKRADGRTKPRSKETKS